MISNYFSPTVWGIAIIQKNKFLYSPHIPQISKKSVYFSLAFVDLLEFESVIGEKSGYGWT